MRRLGICAVTVLVAAGLLAACTTMADHDSEAAKIAALNKKWLGLVARKDAEGVSQLYAANGAIMAPGGPAADGRKAVAGVWAGFFKLPNVSIGFRTTELVIAKSGDLASDRGTYDLAFDGDKGRVKDSGKYIVVWTKVGGQWQVLADIFNSDGAE